LWLRTQQVSRVSIHAVIEITTAKRAVCCESCDDLYASLEGKRIPLFTSFFKSPAFQSFPILVYLTYQFVRFLCMMFLKTAKISVTLKETGTKPTLSISVPFLFVAQSSLDS